MAFTLKDIADKLNVQFHASDNNKLKDLLFTNDDELIHFNGSRKGIPQFLKQVLSLYPNINQEKLYEDYCINTKLIRANRYMVRDYHKSTHLYPNLEFIYEKCNELTMEGYSKQFEMLNGVILPINSHFWNTYLPPNHFEDMCSVRITDKEVTDIPNNLPIVDIRFIVDRHKLFFDKPPFCVKQSSSKNIKQSSSNSMIIDINKLLQDAIKEVYDGK